MRTKTHTQPSGLILEYQVLENGIKVLKSPNSDEFTEIILDEIDGVKIIEIGYNFLYYNKVLTSFSAPNLTTVGDNFLNCNKVLIIPNLDRTDGLSTFIESTHTHKGYSIIKGRLKDKIKGDITFIAKKDGFSAHGKSLKEAINDCNFKLLQSTFNVTELVKEIKSKGVMTIQDYRLLTGACKQGVESFMSSNGLEVTELPLQEAIELTKNAYGSNRINELFN